MPALLVVPPTEFVTENIELRRPWEAEARAWRETQKQALGLTLPAEATLASGAFRGTEFFAKDDNESQILFTAFLFPPGAKGRSPFLRLAALLRQSDCVCRGATWDTNGATLPGLPTSLAQPVAGLDKAAKRTLDFQNTYRFDMQFSGPFSRHAQMVLDLVSAERFAAGGLPVVSSLGRLLCDAALTPPQKEKLQGGNSSSPETSPQEIKLGPGLRENGYPARAHRIVVGRFSQATTPQATASVHWPVMTGQISTVSGLFGDKKTTVVKVSGPKEFDPVSTANAAFDILAPQTHRLGDKGFRITRRQGRWVYLDRGRAYGLEIGQHLVSGAAKLHVIQYAPWTEGFDVAIAMVRQEPTDKPLKMGDTVTFDPSQFPPGGSGAVPIPLAPPK